MQRIAIVGIATESCTFSPLSIERMDFAVHRGEEMWPRYPFLAEASFTAGTDWLPLIRARALPGGRVLRSVYESLKEELLQALRTVIPVDGVYLDLHGAMSVEGLDDAEADLAEAVRGCTGPDCLLGASTDLHANISARFVEQVEVITTYRTAPHEDELETREKACQMMIRALAEGVRPLRAWVRIPTLLPGERTSTQHEPARSLYQELATLETAPGIWDASLWVGYAWADEARSGSAVVVSGTDADTLCACAEDLAQRYWDQRTAFNFGVQSGSAERCLDWALAEPGGPVLVSDAGDNPTAGGAGDIPHMLEQMLARPDFGDGRRTAIYASLVDEDAVVAMQAAGVGADVSLRLGGKLDPLHGTPLPVRGRVLTLDPGGQAVLALGEIRVIITTRRSAFHRLEDFRRLDLDPETTDITVVKLGYLTPELKACARQAFLALTPGAVDQDIERLPFRAVLRPIFPLDPDMHWKARAVQFSLPPTEGGS